MKKSNPPSREIEFEEFISSRVPNILCGKIVWGNSELKISVDNSILSDTHAFLIEIDSSNYAKLVCGQYTLINILKEQPLKLKTELKNKELIFVVIHCYDSHNRKYNQQRTLNNLNLVKENCFSKKGIKFAAFHIIDFKNETEKFKTKQEFCNYIINEIINTNK